MSLPSKKITIEILENSYEISFPKNRQLFQIASLKQELSNGNHNKMIFGGQDEQMSYLLIEAIAAFSILIPSLQKDLKIDSLLELDPYESIALVKAYSGTYYPWIQEWRKIINEEIDGVEKKEDEK